MGNVLDLYDPLFYAQEAIIALEKSLGMAARVHRGYDKNPQDKGSTIKISKPSVFTAQNAPSTAQDIKAGDVSMTLDQWKEVKFKLTDKELTFTGEKIIQDHIRPAAYALADDIDQKLVALYKDVPWSVAASAPLSVANITGVRKVLRTNKVNLSDGQTHAMLSPTLEDEALQNAAFTQWQGSGPTGEASQLSGNIGTRYGLEFFANQNAGVTHTAGVSADATGALVGAHAIGASTVSFDGVTTAGTFKAGDSFVIAGSTQRYVFTADQTASAGAVTAAPIYPPLVKAYDALDVITITLTSGDQSLVFHRTAFALAMAPLAETGGRLGAEIATVVSPESNLAIRSRLYYMPDVSEVVCALDVLYAVKTLDGNRAVRLVD
jgi:hypothetical protein